MSEVYHTIHNGVELSMPDAEGSKAVLTLGERTIEVTSASLSSRDFRAVAEQFADRWKEMQAAVDDAEGAARRETLKAEAAKKNLENFLSQTTL